MPIITIETKINAPIERVFDLSRCIDLHEATMTEHKEKAVAGVMKGLINLDETVTWEAVHFSVRQRLTSKITIYDRPVHFRDSLVSRAFKRFDHDHFFEESGGATLMRDVFDYDSPYWIFGAFADWLFLESYMRKLLENRNELIRKIAESDDWKRFLE